MTIFFIYKKNTKSAKIFSDRKWPSFPLQTWNSLILAGMGFPFRQNFQFFCFKFDIFHMSIYWIQRWPPDSHCIVACWQRYTFRCAGCHAMVSYKGVYKASHDKPEWGRRAIQPVGIIQTPLRTLFLQILLLLLVVLLVVWESVLVRDRVMLLLIRFVGENEGNDVDLQPLHNGGSPIILRGEDPPPPIIILQPGALFLSLSVLSFHWSGWPLTSSFHQRDFSMQSL